MDSSAFVSILDAISQGVVVFGADRRIIFCNQAFMDITGFDRSEVAGALCHIMQGSETKPETIQAIDSAIHSRREFRGEIKNYRKSGETFWNDLHFKPEFNEDGSFRHFIGISRDITDFKNAQSQVENFEIQIRDRENELQLISSHLKNAQRAAKIGVFDYSVSEDLQYWSEELIEMIAFDKENFPAPSDVFISRIDQSDLPNFTKLFNNAVENGVPYEVKVRVHRYDGGMIYMQIIADVRDVPGDRRITGIARDVTEETLAAQQLLEEKQRFELAARATQDVLFEWDVETGAYWANDAFEAVYGYPAPSHISLNALDGISAVEADHDFVREVTLDAIASGKERYSVDYGFKRSDGTRGHAAVRAFIVRDENGNAQRIIGTGTDVGQLSDAIQALEASEERFRIIADTVSDVLWDRNFDTDTMWVTPGWPLRLGIAIDQEVSMSHFFARHVEPEDCDRVQKSFRDALKSDQREWEIQYTLIGRDGGRIDMAVKAAILRHPDGRAHRMLGNARNVTIEKRQQEGFSRARALEAVGQLTGGVAHDFNNQLMIIQGNAELLEMSELDDDQAESVSLINQACASAADLTQRLLSFSRQSHLQTGRVDLNKIIPNTVTLLRAGIPESITVQCHLPSNLWQAKVDANALEQALINLAVNARDAMPNGGNIVIGAENRSISRDMESLASELEPGEYVMVSVTDNGEGMSPEILAKVFEPFFTTKEVGKGTGLGLSTVYGFAKQSNGHVTIYSEVQHGTSVNIYVPRFVDEFTWEEPSAPTNEPKSGKGQRILLVEDQPNVRSHVQKLLTKMGYVVTAASDGLEAIAILRRGLDFDLLFTDVIMPGGMNGEQLAQEAAKIDPDMKVLFTSGYPAFAFEHLQLEEIDSLRLLTKPYRSSELADVLAELLDS